MHFRSIAVLAGMTAIATFCYMTLWMDIRNQSNQRIKEPTTELNDYDYSHQPSSANPNDTENPPLIREGLPSKSTEEQDEQAKVGEADIIPEDEEEDEGEEEEGDGSEATEQHDQDLPADQGNTKTDASFGERNARLAAKHINAHVTFCQQKQPRYLFDGTTVAPKTVDGHIAGKNNDDNDGFSSYSSWIDHVRFKNSRDFSMEEHRQTFGDQPVFFERPPTGWALDLAAIQEPCDRRIHSSAHCLAFLAAQESTYLTRTPASVEASREPMNVHIFWRGPITDKLSLSAHAFLFTQPLDRAHLHLWIDSADLPNGLPEDYAKNPYAAPLLQKPFSNHVTIHAWDYDAESRFSYPDAKEAPTAGDGTSTKVKVKPVALSDAARFLILNRNGGMYLDADVMLLRDMAPLFDSGLEFAYEWSNTQNYNTAILRLQANSTVARRILDGAKAREEQLREQTTTPQAAAAAASGWSNKVGNEEAWSKERPHRQGPNRLAASAQLLADQHRTADIGAQAALPKGAPRLTRSRMASRHGHDDRLSKATESNSSSSSSSSRRSSTRTKKVLRDKRADEKTEKIRPYELYHPVRLRQYLSPEDNKIEGNGLIMMPVAVFDPLWLRIDRAESRIAKDYEPLLEDLLSFPAAITDVNAVCPAQKGDTGVPAGEEDEGDGDDDDDQTNEHFAAGPEVFLTGAYAYHWHNGWTTPIAPESWMGRMFEAYKDFAAGRRPNLYGEWIKTDL